MTFEIKIQNMRQFSTWLCSVTIAQILQIIRRKSSAKRKFTGNTAHFIEKGCTLKDIPVRAKLSFWLKHAESRPHYYHARDTIFLFYRVNKTVSRTG